jgi:hypothetical protein
MYQIGRFPPICMYKLKNLVKVKFLAARLFEKKNPIKRNHINEKAFSSHPHDSFSPPEFPFLSLI